ncbi:unnamed protein product [Parascedosporium putredinis]|uniref:GDP-Man:Man(3)GlcNAc(2)-PP-Dol alpha-1,2-mannosyltransferase n=1 Tax=Parascedosporium putredinis TaxID=1442378 RepID=A0A9P1H9R8_9PEZI|nr:unnamed protein product [Parascedosporium putredinis]CAI8001129.1 unnamed protein product [Parascedosporium putredinis]
MFLPRSVRQSASKYLDMWLLVNPNRSTGPAQAGPACAAVPLNLLNSQPETATEMSSAMLEESTCDTTCRDDTSALTLSSLGMLLASVPLAYFVLLPLLSRLVGTTLAWYLRRRSSGRRAFLLNLQQEDQRRLEKETTRAAQLRVDDGWEKIDSQSARATGTAEVKAENGWAGIIGFFHPFCNAGGGGERVLWAAIRATQLRWPNALCVVYTGDHEMSKDAMISRVKNRFNIQLHAPTVTFVYLSTRHLVLASTWPRFTLIGQSIGSVIMAWDAFHLAHADLRLRTGTRGKLKKAYWQLFAMLYSRMGSTIDVVMTNSTWTQAHIKKLWGPYRNAKANPITAVYPPVAVEVLESAIDVTAESEAKREKIILSIAQFRPEKDHTRIIQAFAQFANVRDDGDSKRVYQLRLLANELNIKDRVHFHLDASWPEVLDWLRKASVGVNGMWNEHFGIGVVEYQAAGLISVVHSSGGPKLDIVVDIDGLPTGYHAVSVDEFAEGFEKALSEPNPLAIRQRARKSALRFTEEEFAKKWLEQMEKIVPNVAARG